MLAWLGCVSEDAWLSTFVSPEPVLELYIIVVTRYHEKGVKIQQQKNTLKLEVFLQHWLENNPQLTLCFKEELNM